MKYYVTNNIHIVEIPVKDFSIVMNDSKKKTATTKNYCNAGFFGTYNEGSEKFTLPGGHLVCDFKANSKWTKYYCNERGKFQGDKYTYDSGAFSYNNEFYGKAQSTLIVDNGKASINELFNAPKNVDYAIAGVPIMRNGNDVKFATFVKKQGWDGSPLYGTWHNFIGLKKSSDNIIYLMAMKTTSSNMITSAEAFRKFKAIDMHDVIKLDGGGSFHLNVGGKVIASTAENRRINNIICWKEGTNSIIKDENPYPVPTVALKKGNKNILFNKWLQWQLNMLGFPCEIDGSFGPATLKQVLNFQKSRKLDQDGSVGPATRKALIG